MNHGYLLAGVGIMAALTFATRLLPFLLFHKHQPGPRFRALQQGLPSLVMVILLVWAVKDSPWEYWPLALCALGCLGLAGTLQWFVKNALLSIFLPTILWMLVFNLLPLP